MKAVVLLYSGGADSTLCAMLLRERGWSVHALSIGYEGRPAGEDCAQAEAEGDEMQGGEGDAEHAHNSMREVGSGKREGDSGTPASRLFRFPHDAGLVILSQPSSS